MTHQYVAGTLSSQQSTLILSLQVLCTYCAWFCLCMRVSIECLRSRVGCVFVGVGVGEREGEREREREREREGERERERDLI